MFRKRLRKWLGIDTTDRILALHLKKQLPPRPPRLDMADAAATNAAQLKKGYNA